MLGVDPDAVTRSLVALYLEPHGYHVQLAGTVTQAIQALAGPQVDAFLCSESALVAALLREREHLREALGAVPVVVLLEPGVPAELTRSWNGVREHLTKPLNGVALLAVLQGRAFRRGAGAPVLSSVGGIGDGLLAGFDGLVAETEMDEALARDLALSFVQRAPTCLTELAEALRVGDLEWADRTAHAMKGMSGNLRFHTLVAATERLRAAARQGDAQAASEELAALEVAYNELDVLIRARWESQG